ncbi:MAG: hypothetical protein KIT79_12750 [Deltaproteobacteria bacterium]|nr:hypothetical protein [Deltaproteobacteria bacterium]
MKKDLIGELVKVLETTPRGERNLKVAEYARVLGVSERTLHRRLAAHRMAQDPSRTARRKTRADSGTSRATAAEIEAVAAIQHIARDRSRSPLAPGGGRRLPMTVAIDTARASGFLASDLSDQRLAQLARSLGYRAPEPVRRFQAGRANDVHQLDYSGSSCFAFAGFADDGVPLVRVRGSALERYNAAKDGAEPVDPRRVWILAWVDDHSGAAFSAYFVSPGEETAVILSTLLDSWTGRHGHQSVPFGMPRFLYVDQGPAHKSELFRSCLGALIHPDGKPVRVITTAAGNAQAKGKVERRFRDIKTAFEGRFWLQPGKTYRLDEVNRLLLAFCAERNARAHRSQADHTRFALWQRSARSLTVPGPDAWLNAWETETRQVGRDGTIRFGGVVYRAPVEFTGRKVKVFHSLAGELFAEDPQTKKSHACPPFEFEAFGGGRGLAAPAPQAVERLRKAVESLRSAAFPQPVLGEGQQLTVVQMRGRKTEAQERRPFEEDTSFGSIEEAVRFVLEELDLTADDAGTAAMELLRERLAETGLDRAKVRELAAQLRDAQASAAQA